ncbi:MAG: hypothetical protein OXM55_00305 [Bdellovibrionales bacterium]|nr:hypothetical protein [Bdellovibrionales bacterium]
MKKCIVCKNIVESEEYSLLAPEFKPYPVHAECFDTFTNADEFLQFALKNKSSNKQHKPLLHSPDISPN